MAAAMSRFSSLRTRVPSISSPAARAPRSRRTRGTRMSRIVSPCGGACTCRDRTRRLPDRTTCRSLCKGGGTAAGLGASSPTPSTRLRSKREGGSTRSRGGADEPNETGREDEDPREAHARDQHDRSDDRAKDRGRIHARAGEQEGLRTSIHPPTDDDRADAQDGLKGSKQRGCARLQGGKDCQDATREREQERPESQRTPQARGPSEDAREHATFLVAKGICTLCRGPEKTGSHAPKRVLLAFDCAHLVECLLLVVGQRRAVAERAGVRFRQVNVQQVSAAELPTDCDSVDRDCDLLSLVRSVQALLPAPDRLDTAEGTTVHPHDGLARPNPSGQDTYAKDRGFRCPEDVVAEEQELRRIRDFFAARLGQLPLALVPPCLVFFDEPVDHVVLEQLQVLVFSQRRLCVRQDFEVEGEDRSLEGIFHGRRVRDIPAGHGADSRELDRDCGLLALVRETFEGTDRIGLYEDAVLLRLDLDLRFLRDLLDDRREIPFRRANRSPRNRFFEATPDNLHARRARNVAHGVEPFLRVPDFVERLGPEEPLHLRRAGLAGGAEDARA